MSKTEWNKCAKDKERFVKPRDSWWRGIAPGGVNMLDFNHLLL